MADGVVLPLGRQAEAAGSHHDQADLQLVRHVADDEGYFSLAILALDAVDADLLQAQLRLFGQVLNVLPGLFCSLRVKLHVVQYREQVHPTFAALR